MKIGYPHPDPVVESRLINTLFALIVYTHLFSLLRIPPSCPHPARPLPVLTQHAPFLSSPTTPPSCPHPARPLPVLTHHAPFMSSPTMPPSCPHPPRPLHVLTHHAPFMSSPTTPPSCPHPPRPLHVLTHHAPFMSSPTTPLHVLTCHPLNVLIFGPHYVQYIVQCGTSVSVVRSHLPCQHHRGEEALCPPAGSSGLHLSTAHEYLGQRL